MHDKTEKRLAFVTLKVLSNNFTEQKKEALLFVNVLLVLMD